MYVYFNNLEGYIKYDQKTAMIIYIWYSFESSINYTILIYIQLINIAKLFNKNHITFYNYFEQK